MKFREMQKIVIFVKIKKKKLNWAFSNWKIAPLDKVNPHAKSQLLSRKSLSLLPNQR